MSSASVASRRPLFLDEQNPIRVPVRHANDIAPAASQEPAQERRTAGRPRSETSRAAILDAVSKMLLHMPVRDVSIESIAKKAGVGKTTIYRWWPNKVAVILDALAPQLHHTHPTIISGENPKDLFVQQMERLGRILKGRTGKVVAEVFAESQGDKELLGLFYQNFMVRHEEILANIISQGKALDLFRTDLDTAVAVDMIYGAVFYRLMSQPDGFDAVFLDQMIMHGLRLLSR